MNKIGLLVGCALALNVTSLFAAIEPRCLTIQESEQESAPMSPAQEQAMIKKCPGLIKGAKPSEASNLNLSKSNRGPKGAKSPSRLNSSRSN